MKKILFCNNNLSGMVLFRKEVMVHFLEKGDTVIVVTPYERKSKRMRDLLPKGVVYIPIKMNRTSVNPLADIVYFGRLLKIFKKEKPDYIFTYTIKPNIYGAIAAKLLGIPCSSMIAGLGYTFTNNKFSSRIARTLYRIGAKCSQHLLLLNEENMRVVKEKKLCDERKIVLLSCGEGVDLNHYAFFDNRAENIIFLFIARLIEEKGYKEFVQAARDVKELFPDVKFRVIGNFDRGYPRAISQEQVEADNNSGVIEYLGTTSNMLKYYKEPGCVICIPSYYSEGLNRSLMEGCAVGKPIITTCHPGCKETVVDGKNGFLVHPKDARSLTEAMIRYIKLSDDEKRKMSEESRNLAVQRFDVKKAIHIYDRIVEDHDFR